MHSQLCWHVRNQLVFKDLMLARSSPVLASAVVDLEFVSAVYNSQARSLTNSGILLVSSCSYNFNSIYKARDGYRHGRGSEEEKGWNLK